MNIGNLNWDIWKIAQRK